MHAVAISQATPVMRKTTSTAIANRCATSHSSRESMQCYSSGKVSEYMFFPDQLFPADVAIVFGMSAWHRPLAKAAELYMRGLAPKLLFTGGFNSRIQAIEAQKMAEGALALGIPASALFIESKSMNTAENVAFSIRCLYREVGIGQIQSVLLVAISFHMRRVRLMAERMWPRPVRIGWASYPSTFYSNADWYQSERGRSDVVGEVGKIQTYLQEDLSYLVE